jgi:hypothetical protein
MLAGQLVNAWEEAPEHGFRQPARPDKRDGMLHLLAQLGDAELLGRFIADVVTRDYDGSDNAALTACAPCWVRRRREDFSRNWPTGTHDTCTDIAWICFMTWFNAEQSR